MIRPFVSIYRPEHIKTILDSARENSQIYCASETRLQMTYLFERTIDLVAETAPSWQAFLTHALDKYDTEGKIYIDLVKRMMEAGIWPVNEEEEASDESVSTEPAS